MKEYKIGETFYIGREKFQVVEGEGCKECYFENSEDDFCIGLQDYVGSCMGVHREDAQDVCFHLIKK